MLFAILGPVILLILLVLGLLIPIIGLPLYYLTLIAFIPFEGIPRGLVLLIPIAISTFAWYKDYDRLGLVIAHVLTMAIYVVLHPGFTLMWIIIGLFLTALAIFAIPLFCGESIGAFFLSEGTATAAVARTFPRIGKLQGSIVSRITGEYSEIPKIKGIVEGISTREVAKEAMHTVERMEKEMEKRAAKLEAQQSQAIARELAEAAKVSRSGGGSGLGGAVLLLLILFVPFGLFVSWYISHWLSNYLGWFTPILGWIFVIVGIVLIVLGVIFLPFILILGPLGVVLLGLGFMIVAGSTIDAMIKGFVESLPFNFTALKLSISETWSNFKNSTAYYILTGKWEYVITNPWQPQQGGIIRKPEYALTISEFDTVAKPKYGLIDLSMKMRLRNDGSSTLENVYLNISYELLAGDEENPSSCPVSFSCKYVDTNADIRNPILISKMAPGFEIHKMWRCYNTTDIPPKIAKCESSCPACCVQDYNCSGTGCTKNPLCPCSCEAKVLQRSIKFVVLASFKAKAYAETKVPVFSKEEYYKRLAENEKIPGPYTTYVAPGPVAINFGYSPWPLVYGLMDNKATLMVQIMNKFKGNVRNIPLPITPDLGQLGSCELYLCNETALLKSEKTKIISKIDPDKSVELCCIFDLPEVTASDVLKEYYIRVEFNYTYEFAAEKTVKLE